MKAKLIPAIGLLFLGASLARADFNPIPLTPGSYNQDMVVEQSAPPAPASLTTATLDSGTGNSGNTWYERGYNTSDLASGLPPHGTTFTSTSQADHSYAMAPGYWSNDAILIASDVSSATITLTPANPYSKLSFLSSAGHGPVVVNYTVHHADSTTESGSISVPDWFGSGTLALGVGGRVDVGSQSIQDFGAGGLPYLFSQDITLTDTASAVMSIDLSYVSGGSACILALSGSTGGAFTPITFTGYNEDMVVEATGVLHGAYTTASMDGGTANNGDSWYEQGYNASAPSTGLPAAGSTFVSQAAGDHNYTMAPSYTANNAAFIDGTHSATLTPAAPNAFSALSLLTAAGNGPVGVDYKVHYADGTTEIGYLSAPDWFFNNPVTYVANGRVDVNSGAFDSVNGNNPRLYSVDIALGNPGSAVTSIDLSYDPGNSGGRVAVMALSGLPTFSSPTAPFNAAASPLVQTQYVGGTATFSVTASGTPPLSYQWLKGTSALGGKTGVSLSLAGLALGDAGSYSCIVSNSTGLTATSGVVVLTVLSLPLGYSGTTLGDQPLAYYRLNEPGPLLVQVATNLGSFGASGNGTHFPGLTHQVPGAIVGDPDTAAEYSAIDPVSDDGAVSTIVPYLPALNPAASFSVELWLKPTVQGNLGNAQAPLNNQYNDGSGNRFGWDFFQRAAANQTPDSHGPGYSFRMFNGTAGSEDQTTVFNITGGNYVVGQWSHLVAVYDATVPSATLYLNGQQVAQSAGGNGSYVPNPASPFSIGGYPDSSQNPFIGPLDEVAIYTNALTSDQVLAHYENGTNAARVVSYPSLITGDGAVEYLRLDEPARNVAWNYGSLGSLANGTYANAQPGAIGPRAPVFPGFGAGNLAGSFNGTNTYVELENPPALNFTGPISLEAWIQPAPTQNSEAYILAHGYNDIGTGEVVLRIQNGSYFAGSYNGNNHGASFTVPAADLAGKAWVHLAGTYDGAHWNLYRNGVLVASAADSTGAVLVNNANWAIGARGRWKRETGLVDPGQDTRMFTGIIDEAAIYNFALTPSQVQAHYAKAVQPLAISLSGGQATLTWPLGLLLEATNITGPWTTNMSAAAPSYLTPASSPRKFYRVQF
ncbi:MAG TPA: LamG-like jellyroll fold domain-containing protein [Candidatus Acidoferrum sp.]|nr:LamG-like jellyroll fold domain-containing protein [Candidatus Acidoferrum sp.]